MENDKKNGKEAGKETGKQEGKENGKKRRFTLIDYPEKGKDSGLYTGKSPASVASKIFTKLSKSLNFYDNLDGTKYLVFYVRDLDSKKIYSFIGTVIILKNPVEINYSKKNIKLTHRNIVAKYDNNMREVFRNFL